MTSNPVAIAVTRFDAAIFDLDGVITDTARVHFAAWKRVFDEYLRAAGRGGAAFGEQDYFDHVDGRSRVDGVVDFLQSRGITVERGSPDDVPGSATAWAIANHKNAEYLAQIGRDGVTVFPGSIELVRGARAAGLRTAVVTASRNRSEVLASAGIDGLFDAHVDGNDAADLHLAGKPNPATFLEAARRLDVRPDRAVVFEDAIAGVEAGHAGGFGLVIGVDRHGGETDLAGHGADVVVDDLGSVHVVGTRR